MNLKSVYDQIRNTLKTAAIDTPDIDARFIVEHRTAYDISDLIAKPDALISASEYHFIMQDLEERLSGKPLSRIYGEREFWGLNFKISQDTLDPRPDTERIIELALEKFTDNSKPLNILDLGTGSGCILIALLSEFPNALGVGTDISLGALQTAKQNAHINTVESRAHFICTSWLDSCNPQLETCNSFNLIVSNPPYISNQITPTLSKEVQNHDPILALDGGVDGLEPYKTIFPTLKNYLSDDGSALFEIGYDQADDVMRLAEKAGFMQRRVHLDHAGNPRVVDISRGDK